MTNGDPQGSMQAELLELHQKRAEAVAPTAI
jgi:hypothetical protein